MTQPEYKVMGGDGQEYGQIHAEQIRQWFAEGRLEKKTPVIPPGARDWVFLESLPEFADLFQLPVPPTKRQIPKFLKYLAGIVLVVLALFWELLWLLHKQSGHH